MTRRFSYTVTEANENMKLEEFLRNLGYSHHIIVHLKKTAQGICVNKEWAYTNRVLQCGDIVDILLCEESSSEGIKANTLPLSIVYEDEDILIVNKAADTPIHPSIHNYENTLANAVMHYYHAKGETFVYRCINRLDRDTTGLLIIAKNMLSGAILSRMSAAREIHREYLAICEGLVDSKGTVDAPIARRDDSVIERCVDFAHGETAITHYRRLEYRNGYSLVSCCLETGRTHQIRVHMKHLGHPLPGDFLYHPEYSKIKRQALHSYRLQFMHPISKEPVSFIAPLPDDMAIFFN